MLQKKLVIAGIMLLGASSIALANGGGYGAAPVSAAPAPMNESSFYVGVGAGYADTQWSNIYAGGASAADASEFANATIDTFTPAYSTTSQKAKDSGFAGRIFAGYNFNQYLAIEGGWTYLPKASFNTAVTTQGISINPFPGPTYIQGVASTAGAAKITNYAFDLLGKLSAPLAEGFSLYGKAGLAYTHSKASGTIATLATVPVVTGVTSQIAATAPFTFANGKTTVSHWGPAFGAGLAYDITPNLVADASWMHYVGHGKAYNVNSLGDGLALTNGNYIPASNVGLLSIAYKFSANM